MSNYPNNPPIIITGMHRSGTTMVTRLLEKLGLFVGWRKDPNQESLLFLQLNEWLLRQAGATWDNPEPIRRLLENDARRELVVQVLRNTLDGYPSFGHLGPLKSIRFRTPFALTDPWGWKDPRNTLTQPLWMDIFPDAKILHVTRHGVDVASSLAAREGQSLGVGHLAPISILGLFGEPEITPSQQCSTLDETFALWEQYLTFASENRAACGSNFQQIRYEDFLENPEPRLSELAAFCGLPVSVASIQNACAGLNRDRAYAYRGQQNLVEFAQSASTRLAKFNY